jgi:hypothetical protein
LYSDETVSHLAVGNFANEFVGRLAAPEVNARDLEELPRGLAKKLDQIVSARWPNRFGGNAALKSLKGSVRPGSNSVFRGND